MGPLEGRTALATGGDAGIGPAGAVRRPAEDTYVFISTKTPFTRQPAARVPPGRLGRPEENAARAPFLASEPRL